MKTIAERFRYYANHPDYDPDEGMCYLLKKHEEHELLEQLHIYMYELGSSTRVFLQEVLDIEGWDLISWEVYMGWDNRPRIEDADTFKVGDKVIYQGEEGEVIAVHDVVFGVKVLFEGRSRVFTHNGRHTPSGPRELKHANTYICKLSKSKTTQEIFNVVLSNNLYGEEGAFSYMCNALTYAEMNGYITSKERDTATRAIRRYIGPKGTLYCFLQLMGIPQPTDELMLEIYKNWEERWEIVERHKKSLS